MISELTGLAISNASLLDEATSAAEAMSMAFNIHSQKRKKFFVSESIFPQIIDVIKTRAFLAEITLHIGKLEDFPMNKAEEYCGLIVQTPDNHGTLKDHSELFNHLREKDVRSIII
jgi:glycine dehydrogenase